MASSKLTQKAVSPLRVSSDESIFSLAGPFVKKRTSTHPQQSLKNMKVILTHTAVDEMGNLVYCNINHQYKCQSIIIWCVQCGIFNSYFQAQTVKSCWMFLIFCTIICHAFWLGIQIKWIKYKYLTLLSCIAVCPLQLSQLSKCGPLLFMAPVSNQTLLDLAQNKSLTLAARIKSSASLHFVAWKYAVQRKQWLLAIILARSCGRRGLGSRNCGQLGNR